MLNSKLSKTTSVKCLYIIVGLQSISQAKADNARHLRQMQSTVATIRYSFVIDLHAIWRPCRKTMNVVRNSALTKKKKTNNETKTIVSCEMFAMLLCVFNNFCALQFLSLLKTLTKTSY